MMPASLQQPVAHAFVSINAHCEVNKHIYLLEAKHNEDVKCTFKYSTNRLRKATKCSARLMFPGTASLSKSSGNTDVDCPYEIMSI